MKMSRQERGDVGSDGRAVHEVGKNLSSTSCTAQRAGNLLLLSSARLGCVRRMKDTLKEIQELT